MNISDVTFSSLLDILPGTNIKSVFTVPCVLKYLVKLERYQKEVSWSSILVDDIQTKTSENILKGLINKTISKINTAG